MELNQIDIRGKRVLVRLDLNVPIDEDGRVSDDTRIRAALPTIKYIMDNGGMAILMSHLGRPEKGLKEDGSVDRDKFSLVQVVDTLSVLLGKEVHFIDDTVGEIVAAAVEALDPGEAILLENTRFYPEEKAGDQQFASQIAALGDIYINDAFGTAHRRHASTATVADFFPKEAKGFGFLMGKEISSANTLIKGSEKPFVAILGGAKVSDKIQLILNMLDKVDHILIGGGMAYTFFKAMGSNIGNSLVEEDHLLTAKSIFAKAEIKDVTIHLPLDSVIADSFSASAETRVCDSNDIPDGWMGLDIGPEARKSYANVIASAKRILWNGPMGVFEMEPFAEGTLAVAEAVAMTTQEGAFSLVGGGDSVAAINQSGLQNQISFISTGGGAMLTMLEGKELPGVTSILK